MSLTKDQVAALYVAVFNRAPDAEGLENWLAFQGTYAEAAAGFVSHPQFEIDYAGMTNQEKVEQFYINILGSAGDAEGIANWVEFLDGGATEAEFLAAFLDASFAYDGDDEAALIRQATLENRVEVALYFTETLGEASNVTDLDDLANDPAYIRSKEAIAGVTADPATVAAAKGVIAEWVAEGQPGDTFMLTANTDVFNVANGNATDGNDTFLAYVTQNPFLGGINNTLSSADRLDGGAGYDYLYAEIVPEYFGATGDYQVDIQPRTTSIERVEFEAREVADETSTVTVDAKHMYGVEKIGSKQSDGDLVIENLTTLANDGVTKRNTSDLTITMDHTDNFNSDNDASDLTVYFDDNYLISGQDFTSSLELRIVNSYELAENDDPLAGFIAVNFQVGDQNVTVDVSGAQVYQDVADAINAKLSELGIQGVHADLTADRTAVFTDDVGSYTQGQTAGVYTPVMIVSSAGSLVRGPIELESNIENFNGLNTWVDTPDVTVDNPISVNIELTKVGRGDDGGNLIVGAKSLAQGIEVFDVTVKGGDHLPNSLGILGTTGGDLETVNISSEVLLGQTTFASLEIRNGFDQASLDVVNAQGFRGDLALGTDDAVQNLGTLNATGGGDVAFFGKITDLNTMDPYASTGTYSYNTGAGNDWIDVEFDGDALDTIGTSLTIDTGAGDDIVYVEMDGGNLSQETMDRLGNLSIDTGAGDDTVINFGEANFYIAAGAGSDFVEIDSEFAGGDAKSGAWIISTNTGAPTWDERVLYQAELTVSFAGFESTVKINSQRTDNFVADQVLINQTIIRAIETNPELARLLETQLGTGDQQLRIEALVAGINELEITINQPAVVDVGPLLAGQVLLATADVAAVRAGLIETNVAGIASNSNAAVVAGAIDDGNLGSTGVPGADFLALSDGGSQNETGVVNFSTINMGTGANDLVVLSSNQDLSAGGSSNTLEFTDLNMGKVSVVNFFDGTGAVGKHVLDFTAFLTDATSVSGSELSSVRVVTSVDDAAPSIAITFAANQVSIINGFTTGATGETWANLGATQLEASLNGATSSWSNLGAGALTTTPNLYGADVYDNIVLIENDLNDGEYKAFHVEVDDTGTTESYSVELIGIIDFGASIDSTVSLA